jgi:hypothetical protein
MKRIKKRVVAIQFLDHCTGSDANLAPVKCEVVGLVLFENAEYIRVASWITEGQADNPNNELYVILKSCILQRRILR